MTIVALDDNQHTLALVRSVLRSLGVERVRCYLRPESALAAIEAAPPEIVITDWELGPTSGLHFARKLRLSDNPRIAGLPIIMLTAHADATLVRAAREAGIDSFVVKPFSAAVLAQHIAAARRRAQGPAISAMPSRAEVLAAETRLAELRRRFEGSLGAVVTELGAICQAIGTDPAARERARRLAHDLKGQGASFSYPLLTEFAGSLQRLLDETATEDPLLLQLAVLHVQAIGAVAQDRVTGDGGEAGQALRQGFARTIARLTGQMPTR